MNRVIGAVVCVSLPYLFLYRFVLARALFCGLGRGSSGLAQGTAEKVESEAFVP